MPRKQDLKCYFGCVIDGPLHRFPKPQCINMEKFKSWKEVLRQNTKKFGDNYIYNQVRLCYRHFEDFYRSPSRQLTRNAIPTLNLKPEDASSQADTVKIANPNTIDVEEASDITTIRVDYKLGPKAVSSKVSTDKIADPNTIDVATAFDTSTIRLDYNLDNADFESCDDFTIEDVPPEPPKEFSWQQSEATVDLAKEGGEVAVEYLQDDLSLYCSDDEERQIILDYKEDSNEHSGFHCNVCSKGIVGFRYVCVQCLDFDLCGGCEANGAHDQHYVLRIPGPRPYREVQRVLARIRKHLIVLTDPVRAGDDAVSIKSEVKEEDEEMLEQEADSRRLQEVRDTSHDEGDPLQMHISTGIGTVAERETESTPSKEELDNIKRSYHRHGDVLNNTSKDMKPPVIKIIPIKDYSKIKISQAIPKMIQSTIEGKTDTSLLVAKPNRKIVINRVLQKFNIAKMPENIKKRRIIVRKSDFNKLLKIQPPAKQLCISSVVRRTQ